MVCRLKQSIYGLNQASRSWNLRFDEIIRDYGYSKNPEEACVYKKVSRSNVVFLVLYVDNILLIGNNKPLLESTKACLGSNFSMKDLCEAAYILGIKITRDRPRKMLKLSQATYIDKMLE